MTEDKKNLRLDDIREEIRKPLEAFAEKLIAKLGKNLQSITVVGSALTEDFRHQSDINTVLVMGNQIFEALNTLANIAKLVSKRRFSPPLLMTPEYIERSRDVFGIEFLDFQLTHKTIFGDDPFAPLIFAKGDVRLQCERELKATLIRLRQGYIASRANNKLVRDILISTSSSLVPLLRAILWLKDIERPRIAEKVFNKAAEEFSVVLDMLVVARRWRHKKTRLGNKEIAAAFQSIYATVEQLALIVDKLEV